MGHVIAAAAQGIIKTNQMKILNIFFRLLYFQCNIFKSYSTCENLLIIEIICIFKDDSGAVYKRIFVCKINEY